MQVVAAAKINLNLRILGRNAATGFHDIDTWMVPLTLGDRLEIDLLGRPVIELQCNDPSLGAPESNLAWRAAKLLLDETQTDSGVRIALQKNIPHGAGLGGGSSDAAAVLVALNQLTGAKLSIEQLEKLAAQLGSDVPFFIRRQPAIARGRGEQLTPQPLDHPLDLLLLKPPFAIPTAWAYARWGEQDAVPPRWIAPQLHDGIEIFNDLERPAFTKYLVLPALKEWLLDHSSVAAAGMSGSGSTMFAILRDPRVAPQLAADAKAAFGRTLWTATCQTLA